MEAPAPAKKPDSHPLDVAAAKLKELLSQRLPEDAGPAWTGQDGLEYSVRLPSELSPGRSSSLMVLRSEAGVQVPQLVVAAWAIGRNTYVSALHSTPRKELEHMFPHWSEATPGASPSLPDRLLSLSGQLDPWGPDVRLDEVEATFALGGLVAYVERSLPQQSA